MSIDYCFHSHTKRCGHAIGEDEEYVIEAIKKGIKVLGFSDHVFLPNLIDIDQTRWMRGDYSLLDDYIDSVNYLKERYASKIEIHVGFEAEFIPKYVDYYKELLESKKIEYLILGQHCFEGEDGHMIGYGSLNSGDDIKTYTKHLIEGMKSGLFKYVCHPDLFLIFYDRTKPLFKECSKEIIEASIKYNCPLEINLGGRRATFRGEDEIYANEAFFKIVSEYRDAKVIVGFDAHNPLDYFRSDEKFAEDLIKNYNLNEIKQIF